MTDNSKYDKIFRPMAAFVLAMIVLGLILIFLVGGAGAAPPGYPPSRATLAALASVTQPLTASGTVLPAVGSFTEGDLFILASTTPFLYRLQGGAWATMTSPAGGGADVPTIDAHIASHAAITTDAHGANQIITGSVKVGAGADDCAVERIGAGLVQIASYVVIPSQTATPTEVTGVIWFDGNTGKFRAYDGSAWHDLW